MSWSSGAVFGAVLFPQTSAMFRNFRHCNRFFYELLTLLERERALTIGLIISASLCGATEIRTRDTLLAYTRFPGVPLQPLEHRSFPFCDCKVNAFFRLCNAYLRFFYF